ncbi:MAG TPA: Ig-like domain-containing protein [Longimicrobium sp.]|nr:Ig-like domain-containing protein [Longimicrobium sp.]
MSSSRRVRPRARSVLRAGSTLVRRLRGALSLAAVPLLLGACGGDGTTDPPSNEVARVEVTATAASVVEAQTVQLSARAATASGTTVSGASFTWTSSNTSIATVDGTGLVRGVTVGSATITAAENASGKSGTLTVTVTPAPVASVTVTVPQARVKSGARVQLSAVVRDAAGRVLTGRAVTWSTSPDGLATVGATGLFEGSVPGRVTVTATSEGRSGSAALEVYQPTPARITLTPALRVISIGDTVHVRAVAIDTDGDTIRGPMPLGFNETRRAGAPVLALTEPGVYRGAALGHTVFQAESGGVWSNAAVVAVLGEGELLATALPNGARNLAARVGDQVTVPVILDMSRAQTPGDLGALELEVGYNASVLTLRSATPGITGSISEGGGPGRYRFAFASSAPATGTRLTVVTLVFEVAATAQPGQAAALSLSFPSAPANTGFAAYPQPIVVTGIVGISN